MNGEKVKIAYIGCGNIVYHFIHECTKQLPIHLAAICDEKLDNLQRFAERYQVARTYTDYKSLLKNEELDAVICFPQDIGHHFEMAKICLLSGVNVFIERPHCITLEQGNELIEIQDRTSKYVMARLNKRFTPAYIMAKDVIARPEFGPVSMYMANYHAAEYESEHSYIVKHIVHHLDLARYLLGEISFTHMDVIKISNQRVGFNLSFTAGNQAIGFIQSGSFQGKGYPVERVEITGLERNVIVDNIRHIEYNRPAPGRNSLEVRSLLEGSDTLYWNENNGKNSAFSYHGFENQLSHFIQCLHKDLIPNPHIGDTIHTYELVHRILANRGF